MINVCQNLGKSSTFHLSIGLRIRPISKARFKWLWSIYIAIISLWAHVCVWYIYSLCFPSFYKGFVLFFTSFEELNKNTCIIEPTWKSFWYLNWIIQLLSAFCVQHHYHIENIVCLPSALDEVLSCLSKAEITTQLGKKQTNILICPKLVYWNLVWHCYAGGIF